MTSPHQPRLASWVPIFCCVSPYCALLLITLAAVFGVQVGTAVVAGLVYLCHRNADRFFIISK